MTVDQTKYQEAQLAYDAGDYRTAAKSFLASAGRGSVGNGAAYHMAGNSLMRLRRHADAVTVYRHALRDETYQKRGSVFANLGAAYVSSGELSEAIAAYESALDEPDYATPYRAWQGIAAAHMERGRAEEAAFAYRKSALDEKNPDPGKSLVNLGLCFMALGRPADAVDAYQAALGFDSYGGRGRALANLGQAYAATGDYAEAVKAFEKATQLHGHQLSAGALQAYETARAATAPDRETVEGWVTGELPPVGQADPVAAPQSTGWGEDELAALAADLPVSETPPAPVPADPAAHAAEALGFGDEAAVSDFFSRTEEDMKVQAREARRAERGSSNGGLTRAVTVAGIGAVVFAVLVSAAYFGGLGWPTQNSTVNGLLVAYSKGEGVEQYWVAVPNKDVEREMAKIPPLKEFTVDDVSRGRDTSTVDVTVTPSDGAPMHSVVTLDREGVGWRVTGVDYNWRSTGG